MNSERKHPTVSSQAELDQRASALVSQWFATGWILRRRDPDYHVDYELERVDRGEPSGAIVFVQQKAHAKMDARYGFVVEKLQSKHLHYYSEQLVVPVFLFVVDVNSTQGYWLFVQEWLDREHGGEMPQQKKVSIRVPTVNKLDDLPAFLTAVRKSIDYMREKHPGSVAAAVRHDTGKLAAIDPRFDVQLDLVSGRKHYHFTPKGDVSFKMNFFGAAVQQVQDLMAFGRPLKIETSGFTIEEFPLWDHMGGKDGLLSLKPEGKSLEFEIAPESGGDWSVRLDGELTRGSKGLFFAGTTKSGPLTCELKLVPPSPNREGSVNVRLKWHLERWTGKPVLELPFFHALREFARATTKRTRMRINFVHEGVRLFKGYSDGWSKDGGFRDIARLLDVLEKARDACRKLRIVALCPALNHIERRTVAEIEFVHAVLSAEGHRIVRTGHSMSMTASSPNETFIAALASSDQKPGAFRVMQEQHAVQMLGVPVELGPVEYVLYPAALNVDAGKFAEFRAGKREDLEVAVDGVGDACLTIRRVEPPVATLP